MNVDEIVARFAANAESIRRLVEGVSDEQARWKPAPGKWSILEVVNHLLDEERDDFRTRLDLTLHHPETAWPGIDPEGWARDRRYNERNLGESLERFLTERRRSLEWLRGLETPSWNLSRTHPVAGELRAGDLLSAWLAHDLIHIKQLARLHYDHQAARLAPYKADYAGRWS
jgi:hypothetical protein